MTFSRKAKTFLPSSAERSVSTPTQPQGPERMWFSEHSLLSLKGVGLLLKSCL